MKNLKLALASLALICSIPAASLACALPPQDKVSAQMKTGETLVLRLNANYSTGYRWIVEERYAKHATSEAEQNPQGMIEIIGRHGGPVGSGHREAITFADLPAGKHVIRLKYARSFEKNDGIRSFTLTVDVK